MNLALESEHFELRAVSPLQELGVYEALWDEDETSFKKLSEKTTARPGAIPSEFCALEGGCAIRMARYGKLKDAEGIQ